MTVRILRGHVLDRLPELPDESVHCCVTSPPYYGLRSYGSEPQVWGGDPNCEHEFPDERPDVQKIRGPRPELPNPPAGWSTRGVEERPGGGAFCHCGAWRGDLGLEPTPELFIAHLVEVFREVRRVLRKDGTLWLNIGDSYNAHTGQRKETDKAGIKQQSNVASTGAPSRHSSSCKPKDLLMIPAQLALALRADGWYLRSEIVWAKKAPMPESVTDRPTCAHEKVFLLTKSAKYFFDQEAVREELTEWSKQAIEAGPQWHRRNCKKDDTRKQGDTGLRADVDYASKINPAGRNMRNVWHLGPEPFPEAHFATFPTEIPRRAILAGTSARGVCPKCGAPWVRVVEKAAVGDWRSTERSRNLHDGAKGGPSGEMPDYHPPRTLGWRASCSCTPAHNGHWVTGPIPATVLDPFLGAGTTALVADQLGRDCIGIELSRPYAVMAENRVRDDAGMFAQIAAE